MSISETFRSNQSLVAEQQFNSAQHLLRTVSKQQMFKLSLTVSIAVLATLCLTAQWYSLCQALYLGVMTAPEEGQPISWLIAFAGFMLFRVLLIRVQEQLASSASVAGRHAVRKALLNSWQRQSVYNLQRQSPAAHATQWLEDVEAFDGYLARYWPQQYITLYSTLIILVAVFSQNWLAALLLLISAPLIPVFMILVGKGAEQLNKHHVISRQRLAGHFLDRIKNLTTIKRLQAINQTHLEIQQRSEQYRHVVMRTLKVAFLSSAVLEFFSSVAIASIALYIGFSLLGAISWGPAMELNLFSGLFILMLAPEFFQPLRTFAQFYHDKAAALAAAGQLVEHLIPADFETSRLDEKSPQSSKTLRLDIRQVAIGFPGASPLHSDLSVSLLRGQCLLISGISGSGKSLLLQSLAGFLPLYSGRILLNDHPLGLSAFAYLPQQPWIINGSWNDNLKVLAPKSTEDEMLEALELVGLGHYVTNHSDGLNRRVNEQGQGLSGGQMQRLALARTLLARRDIILLDEPTASLDSESRDFVITTLRRLKPSVILIVVTHDPELILLADQYWEFSAPEQSILE